MSILLPSLGRARDQARTTVCGSNLRQLGNALQIYTSDNNGAFPFQLNPDVLDYADPVKLDSGNPNDFSVLGKLLPYLNGNRRILECDSSITRNDLVPPSWYVTQYSDTNYIVSGVVLEVKISRIKNASEVICIHENGVRFNNCQKRPFKYWSIYTQYSVGGLSSFGAAHPYDEKHPDRSAGNLLFADGHVERRMRSSIRPADFGLRAGPGVSGNDTDQNNVPGDPSFLSSFDP